MSRAALLPITFCTLAACGSSAASSSPVSSSSRAAGVGARCGPPAARTLAAGAQARVYEFHGAVYACLTGSRRKVKLGTAGSCLRASRVDRAAAQRRLVATAVTHCGVDTGQSEIEVRRLPKDQRLYSHIAITNPGPESFSTVTGLVLSGAGTVAWLARSSSIVSHRTTAEVWAGGPHGTRLLDSGPAVQSGSLRLIGYTVRWQHGSVRRSARLS